VIEVVRKIVETIKSTAISITILQMSLVLRRSNDQRVAGKHLSAVQSTVALKNTLYRVAKVSRIWGS
jgi:hypothetical protein